MPNPVLVFFNKTREVDGWQYSGPLPTGWTEDLEQKNPQVTSEKFILIVLPDDSQKTPTLQHTNKNIEAPIQIVAHGGADMNGVSWKPEENDIVKQWGRPDIIDVFTHQNSNESFTRIKNLLTGSLSPVEFINSYSSKVDLSILSKLALICQIQLLDSAVDLSNELEGVLANYPDKMTDIIRKFKDACFDDDEGHPDWAMRLRIITDYAILQTEQRGEFN